MHRRCIHVALVAALSVWGGGEVGANELVLIKESAIAALMLDAEDDDDLEASGVYAFDGRYYVVFDNKKFVAVIDDQSWSPNGPNDISLNQIVSGAAKAEGITYAPDGQRWIVIEEERLRSEDDEHSNRNGRVFEYRLRSERGELERLEKSWLPFNFQRENKGFEGVSLVRHEGEEYLLALCEGNDCDGKSVGKRPGNGKIKVFARDGEKFEYLASMDLPRSLPFTDYSGMDVRNGVVAVVSQETSALWVGTLDPQNWRIQGDGDVYWFPKELEGAVVYCNVEGVSWIDEDTVVVVSDARKKAEQPTACAAKEQSIHVFRLPIH